MTYDQLIWILSPLPRNSQFEVAYSEYDYVLEWMQINTPLREAAFIAQLAHESGRFLYSEELASGRAYEGRRDLGNLQPGDGVRFKGRGFIQITGRDNYTRYSHDIYNDDRAIENPWMLANMPDSMHSAGWFWWDKNLNPLADESNFRRITKIINGGYNGWEDRLYFYNRALYVLGLPEYREN